MITTILTLFLGCQFNVNINIDSSFKNIHRIEILNSLYKWHVISEEKICFDAKFVNINPDEILLHDFDNRSTIYSKNLQNILLILNYNKVNSDFVGITSDSDGNSDIFILYDDYFFNLLMLHEVGHLLGLNHSNNRNDLMFPELRNDVSNNDVIKLKCIMQLGKLLTVKNNCK